MPLRAVLDELERVDRRLRLRARQQLADRILLTTVALCYRPLVCALDQVEGHVRCRRRPVDGIVDRGARSAEDRLRVRPVRLLPFERLCGELARERERLVHKLGRLEQPVRDPELRDLGRLEHPVLPQGVRHDHLDRGLGPDKTRQ